VKVEFRASFAKDLRKVKDAPVRKQLAAVITLVEQAKSLQELENIKKLKGAEGYYRIRIGDYRLGLVVDEDALIFVRFLHRKDIYRYFP
jgi:mRNA interferase RelE/StbE